MDIIYTYVELCKSFLDHHLDDVGFIIINENGKTSINKKRTEISIDNIQPNTPCLIDNHLFALWDMRSNYFDWNNIDIACGIAHELFHCAQIKYGIWKKCKKNNYFNYIPPNDTLTDSNFMNSIPENVKDTILIEGTAQYFELLCKSKISYTPMHKLLSEYRLFAQNYHEYIEYYIGAYRTFYLMNIGKFNWNNYFNIS